MLRVKSNVDLRGQRSHGADWTESQRDISLKEPATPPPASEQRGLIECIFILHTNPNSLSTEWQGVPNKVAGERNALTRTCQTKGGAASCDSPDALQRRSRLNKDGPIDISITPSLAGGCDKTISTSGAGRPANASLMRGEDKKSRKKEEEKTPPPSRPSESPLVRRDSLSSSLWRRSNKAPPPPKTPSTPPLLTLLTPPLRPLFSVRIDRKKREKKGGFISPLKWRQGRQRPAERCACTAVCVSARV